MTVQQKQIWKPGKRDLVFLALVFAVVLVLVLGSSDRTTVSVPADETHRASISREACMSCHGVNGIKPQSVGHTKADQCFQCHTQPDGWQGVRK